MSTERLVQQYPILTDAWNQCTLVWKGIEQNGTVHKFNRKELRKIVKANRQSVDKRLVGGNDNMIEKVGKPGSPERVVALAAQYARLSESESSPFGE
jgi:tRNA G37 N-methylase TrmD